MSGSRILAKANKYVDNTAGYFSSRDTLNLGRELEKLFDEDKNKEFDKKYYKTVQMFDGVRYMGKLEITIKSNENFMDSFPKILEKHPYLRKITIIFPKFFIKKQSIPINAIMNLHIDQIIIQIPNFGVMDHFNFSDESIFTDYKGDVTFNSVRLLTLKIEREYGQKFPENYVAKLFGMVSNIKTLREFVFDISKNYSNTNSSLLDIGNDIAVLDCTHLKRLVINIPFGDLYFKHLKLINTKNIQVLTALISEEYKLPYLPDSKYFNMFDGEIYESLIELNISSILAKYFLKNHAINFPHLEDLNFYIDLLRDFNLNEMLGKRFIDKISFVNTGDHIIEIPEINLRNSGNYVFFEAKFPDDIPDTVNLLIFDTNIGLDKKKGHVLIQVKNDRRIVLNGNYVKLTPLNKNNDNIYICNINVDSFEYSKFFVGYDLSPLFGIFKNVGVGDLYDQYFIENFAPNIEHLTIYIGNILVRNIKYIINKKNYPNLKKLSVKGFGFPSNKKNSTNDILTNIILENIKLEEFDMSVINNPNTCVRTIGEVDIKKLSIIGCREMAYVSINAKVENLEMHTTNLLTNFNELIHNEISITNAKNIYIQKSKLNSLNIILDRNEMDEFNIDDMVLNEFSIYTSYEDILITKKLSISKFTYTKSIGDMVNFYQKNISEISLFVDDHYYHKWIGELFIDE